MTCLPDIVLLLKGEIMYWSLMGVKELTFLHNETHTTYRISSYRKNKVAEHHKQQGLNLLNNNIKEDFSKNNWDKSSLQIVQIIKNKIEFI